MPSFGKSSKRRLVTCHAVLQELMHRLIVRRDCSVVCGHRGEDDQNRAFDEGKSRVRWPDGKHNKTPSRAVDVVPWPEKWASESAFLELSKIIKEEWVLMEAKDLTQGFRLRWGGDWDGDGDREDQIFDDLPHWELI